MVLLNDYGWARALNAGVRAISAEPGAFVLAISHEVHVHRHHIDALVDASGSGVSCAYASFQARRSASYRMPRNTFCMWPCRTLLEEGLFDERLDERGGMEDYDLALRLFAHRGLVPRLAARGVVLDRPDPSAHLDKCRREAAAMRQIESRHGAAVVSAFRRALDQELA